MSARNRWFGFDVLAIDSTNISTIRIRTTAKYSSTHSKDNHMAHSCNRMMERTDSPLYVRNSCPQ
jgi:hypothetical protein